MPSNEGSPRRSASAIEWLLRMVCAVMLIGHGWMCWNGQMPLRALLWDEELASGAVQKFAGMDWGAWVSSMEVDDGINRAIRFQAWVYFLFALAVLVPIWRKAFGFVYLVAAMNLGFLAWLKYHDVGLGLGQLIEHASQFCLPVVLALLGWGKRWATLAKVSLVATFVGHGLFAIGLSSEITWLNHPRPGSFTEMTMLSLEFLTENAAGRILLVAGIVDLLVAVMIFLPPRWRRTGLWYMAGWGLLTALARPWAYYDSSATAETLIRWIPELLYRAPHVGLPLCLLFALRRTRADSPRPAAPS